MPNLYPFDDGTKVNTPTNRLRRQLLKGTMGTAIAAAAAYLGWTKIFFPPAPLAHGSKLGPVSDFPAGAPPKQVNVTTPGTDRVAVYFVENLGEAGFRVLSAKCTHQGCSVGWQPKQSQFLCPCHGAQFDAAGKVLAAPAQEPLPVFLARVQGGVLYLAS